MLPGKKIILITTIFLLSLSNSYTQEKVMLMNDNEKNMGREKLLLDYGWKFSRGNSASIDGDFGYGTEEVFAKAGESNGPASKNFNDSTWRVVNLPHDWAVELPFEKSDNMVLNSHGYKPLGRQYPQNSIGWYRRTFATPKTDEGKRITIKFDGVFRDCMVWLNGSLIGRNLSGYNEFDYDVTDYINYGGNNILVVRVDASLAEGWFL